MRPVSLTMSAFGSFADRQTIDFSTLGAGGIYLISGETGAGKTTIFDAVSFALFGEASGAGRKDYTMLTSDFADEKAKTFVAFTFLSGGEAYEITRSIRRRGQEVLLTLPGGDRLNGRRNVEAKIAEIVGLDREQFRQIVMIAQNDFLRFLQSGADERLKILRRIFGTEALRQLQDRLRERAKEEKEKLNRVLLDFNRHGVDVYKRDEQFRQWETRIGEDKGKQREIEKELSLLDEQKMALAASLAVAETLARNFASLSDHRRALAAHEARGEEMAAERGRAERGEIALRRVKPVAEEAARTAKDHETAAAAQKEAELDAAAARTERDQARTLAQSLPSVEEARSAFSLLSGAWEAACEKRDALERLGANREEIEERQTTLQSLRAERTLVQQRLDQLPQISAEEETLHRLTADLAEKEALLTDSTALLEEHMVIRNKQLSLTEAQTAFESVHAGFSAADRRYRSLEEKVLRNQAGILAAGLMDGVPCPVCGAVDHPAPAAVPGEEVTEDRLKKAREAREKAASLREVKAAECGALKTEADTMIRRFVSDLVAVMPEAAARRKDVAEAGAVPVPMEAAETALPESPGLALAKMTEPDSMEAAEAALPESPGLALAKMTEPDSMEAAKTTLPERTSLALAKMTEPDSMEAAEAALPDGTKAHPMGRSAAEPVEAIRPSFENVTGTAFENVTDAAFLEDVGLRLSQARASAAAAAADLTDRKRRAEQALANILAESDSAAERLSDLTPRIAGLEGEIDTRMERYLLDLKAWLPAVDWASSASASADLLDRTRQEAERLTDQKEREAEALRQLTEGWEAAVRRNQNAESALQSAETLVSERMSAAEKLKDLREDAHARYADGLRSCGFGDPQAYEAALIGEAELAALRKRIGDYEKEGEQLVRDIRRLAAETAGQREPDLVGLRNESATVLEQSAAARLLRDEIRSRLSGREQALKELQSASADFVKAEASYAAVRQLADTANGRLDFETYGQTAYFERVLGAANLRLKRMSQNRYTLRRKEDEEDRRTRMGLGIEVLDAYTGKARPSGSLSGGESFMASLSLALGLSDVVQQSAGGISLDAMFIDEGFGSLDGEALDLAVQTLSEMAGRNRTVGIISHVAELGERIERQIRVEKTPQGSRIHMIL